MPDKIRMQGMVLSTMPIGEYDKRVTILTTAYGKIGAFARGAKRPGSSLMAATEPFVFGEFELIEGRSSYTMVSAHISEYFEPLRSDVTAACYGAYFLEIAAYYGRENDDDLEMLKLLYQTIRVLSRKILPSKLIRCVYELRVMTINGEGPYVGGCVRCRRENGPFFFSFRRSGLLCSDCVSDADASALKLRPAVSHALRHIAAAPIEKLYSFNVTDDVLEILSLVISRHLERMISHHFKSLDILSVMEDIPIAKND